jgi:protein-tyrosine phosphatase
LDLTAEFNEVSFIHNHHDYLCIPISDILALTVEQLEKAVSWIMTHLAHKGVLVHCALG